MEHNKKTPDTKIKVSEDVRREIFKYVEESYKNDVGDTIGGKKCWKITGMTFETLSKITIALGGVLSFSSGYFNATVLSFVSGSVAVAGLSLLQFATFGFKQSKKRAQELNLMLEKLNLDTVPILEDDMGGAMGGNERKLTEGEHQRNSSNLFSVSKQMSSSFQQMPNLDVKLPNIDIKIPVLPTAPTAPTAPTVHTVHTGTTAPTAHTGTTAHNTPTLSINSNSQDLIIVHDDKV